MEVIYMIDYMVDEWLVGECIEDGDSTFLQGTDGV
jgi:hypothetical protein